MHKHRILIYGKYADEFEQFVSTESAIKIIKASNRKDLEAFLPTVEMVAGFNFLEGLNISHLKWIHSFTDGIEGYLKLPLPQDIILTKTVGKMPVRIAHYCLTYLGAELLDLARIRKQHANRDWDLFKTERFYEQDVIVLGTGNLGENISKVLSPLVNTVMGVNSSGNDKSREFQNVIAFDEFKSMAFSNTPTIIINTLPATSKTENIINQALIERFKGIIYLNVGRGSTNDEDALMKGLEAGHIKHAILDVFKEEPLPSTHPFWNHPKVTVTPHYSGLTSFEDIKMDFFKAFHSVLERNPNDLWVDLKNEY